MQNLACFKEVRTTCFNVTFLSFGHSTDLLYFFFFYFLSVVMLTTITYRYFIRMTERRSQFFLILVNMTFCGGIYAPEPVLYLMLTPRGNAFIRNTQ